jgi:hypothetical protein
MENKIITQHVLPPIPTRNFDWCAYWDGWEEEGNYGWGETEELAIHDLKTNYDAPKDGGSK